MFFVQLQVYLYDGQVKFSNGDEIMKIAILGLGTIGNGVYELARKSNAPEVKKILDIRVWMDNMTTDINDIVNDDEIVTVVETMGGLHPAYEYAVACIESGKNYVTANKFLVSEYGMDLAERARRKDKAFLFSASCGGGIPYLYNLGKIKTCDKIVSVGGILNGTTNFILDSIFTYGKGYEDALKEAQELGYAEKDPTADVEGLDTQRKLTLACAVAFSKMPKPSDIPTFGIGHMKQNDIDYAKANGKIYRLTAKASFDGLNLDARVMPELIGADRIESGIRKNINIAWYEGESIGQFSFTGQGAGRYPTAGNILRDAEAIAAGDKLMLPDDTVISKVECTERNRYYVRVPFVLGSNFADCKEIGKTGDYVSFETVPMTAQELKTRLDNETDLFAAII